MSTEASTERVAIGRQPRQFRFGLAMQSNVTSSAGWREQARKVEDFGYSTMLVGDHFVSGDNPPAMVALAAAASATDRLRIGTFVLGNDYRHPAVLAKDAATLDVLSDGRLELGLGAGWLQADYDALGFAYDPPGVRVDRLGEALQIIKSSWRGQPFDFDGEHYAIRGYSGLPVPAQEPHPPIIVGGGGPRVLRLAGQHADVVALLHAPMRAAGLDSSAVVQNATDVGISRKLAWVKQGAGERFDDIELQMMYWTKITDDAQNAAAQFASALDVGVDDVQSTGMALIGTVDHVCDLLQERRDKWGVSYVVVLEENCDDFAPVVARLAGS